VNNVSIRRSLGYERIGSGLRALHCGCGCGRAWSYPREVKYARLLKGWRRESLIDPKAGPKN